MANATTDQLEPGQRVFSPDIQRIRIVAQTSGDETMPGQARQISPEMQYVRVIGRDLGELRTRLQSVRSEQAGEKPASAGKHEPAAAGASANNSRARIHRLWFAIPAVAWSLMVFSASLTAAAYRHPGVPGNRPQPENLVAAGLGRLVAWIDGSDRPSMGQPGQTPRISYDVRPVATQPAENCGGCENAPQHGLEEEEARVRPNESGVSGAKQSAKKKFPDAARDFTVDAEQPGTMAGIERDNPGTTFGMEVCPVSWRNGTPVVYFANRAGHVDLGRVLNNCAATVNEATIAQ